MMYRLRATTTVAAIAAATIGLTEPGLAMTLQDAKDCELVSQPDIAIRGCTAVIAARPSDFSAFYNRGISHNKKKQYDRAILDLDRAVQLDQRDVHAFVERGRAFEGKGLYDRALQDLDEAIRLKSNSAIAYANRGVIYYKKGLLSRAIEDYDQAIGLDSGDHNTFNNRGVALRELLRFSEALRDFEAAFRLDPKSGRYLAGRGKTYQKMGQHDNAIRDLSQALVLNAGLDWAKESLAEAQSAKAALAQQANVAAAPGLSRRIALILGNSQYRGIPVLANATNDAADVAGKLKAQGYRVFGYPKVNMTRAEMFAAIQAFQAAAQSADIAMVWYGGHGMEFDIGDRNKANYLLPVDFMSGDDVLEKGVPLSSLINAVTPAEDLRVVFVDACRNANLPSTSRGSRGLGPIGSRGNVLVVYSTTPGDLAEDGKGRNSPFTQSFLERFDAGARSDIRRFISGVTKRTRELTAARLPGPQIPQMVSSMEDDRELPLAPGM